MHHESITNSTFQDTRKLLKLWNYTSAATKGQLYILSSTPLQITRYRIRSVRMHRYCDAGYYKCTSKCIYIYTHLNLNMYMHLTRELNLKPGLDLNLNLKLRLKLEQELKVICYLQLSATAAICSYQR